MSIYKVPTFQAFQPQQPIRFGDGNENKPSNEENQPANQTGDETEIDTLDISQKQNNTTSEDTQQNIEKENQQTPDSTVSIPVGVTGDGLINNEEKPPTLVDVVNQTSTDNAATAKDSQAESPLNSADSGNTNSTISDTDNDTNNNTSTKEAGSANQSSSAVQSGSAETNGTNPDKTNGASTGNSLPPWVDKFFQGFKDAADKKTYLRDFLADNYGIQFDGKEGWVGIIFKAVLHFIPEIAKNLFSKDKKDWADLFKPKSESGESAAAATA